MYYLKDKTVRYIRNFFKIKPYLLKEKKLKKEKERIGSY